MKNNIKITTNNLWNYNFFPLKTVQLNYIPFSNLNKSTVFYTLYCKALVYVPIRIQ